SGAAGVAAPGGPGAHPAVLSGNLPADGGGGSRRGSELHPQAADRRGTGPVLLRRRAGARGCPLHAPAIPGAARRPVAVDEFHRAVFRLLRSGLRATDGARAPAVAPAAWETLVYRRAQARAARCAAQRLAVGEGCRGSAVSRPHPQDLAGGVRHLPRRSDACADAQGGKRADRTGRQGARPAALPRRQRTVRALTERWPLSCLRGSPLPAHARLALTHERDAGAGDLLRGLPAAAWL